jgi:hypothetical protein
LEEAQAAAKAANKAMDTKTVQFEEQARTSFKLAYAFMSLVNLTKEKEPIRTLVEPSWRKQRLSLPPARQWTSSRLDSRSKNPAVEFCFSVYRLLVM